MNLDGEMVILQAAPGNADVAVDASSPSAVRCRSTSTSWAVRALRPNVVEE